MGRPFPVATSHSPQQHRQHDTKLPAGSRGTCEDPPPPLTTQQVSELFTRGKTSPGFCHVKVLVWQAGKVGCFLSNLTSSTMLAPSASNSASRLQFGKAGVYLTLHKPLLSASGGASAFREPGGSGHFQIKGRSEQRCRLWQSRGVGFLTFSYLSSLSRCEQP